LDLRFNQLTEVPAALGRLRERGMVLRLDSGVTITGWFGDLLNSIFNGGRGSLISPDYYVPCCLLSLYFISDIISICSFLISIIRVISSNIVVIIIVISILCGLGLGSRFGV